MNVTIEHIFCPYCEEVINLYFRIMNTILFSCNEAELRTSMERLKKETRLDEYFSSSLVSFSYSVMGHIICGYARGNRAIKTRSSSIAS